MSSPAITDQTGVIITTSIVAVFTGFLFGLHTARGYILPPELLETRRRTLRDPVESDADDVSEDESALDHAPNWANGLDADQRDGLRERGAVAKTAPAASRKHNENEECKLVLVVRTDLGMTKGKMAAQCGHATLACYKRLARAAEGKPDSAAGRYLRRWERTGQAKIAVQCKSQDEMIALRDRARALGIGAEVVADAGRTQIEAGSLTVLGVGPAPKSLVDQVTGELKLL